MIFSSKSAFRTRCRRCTWRAVAGGMSALALTLLASCGGGTTTYDPFVPTRVLAFGDESSALNSDGTRYGVNGLDAKGNVDCNLEPLWVQSVAGYYGMVFAECNPTGAEPRARMFAAVGTRAGDLTAQVEAVVAAGGFRDKDLALVLVGANDVLELYRQYPGRPESDLITDAKERGKQLARVVNRMVDLGAKVVVSSIPDMGLTPFAATEKAANFDIDRAAMLSRLTTAFNVQVGVNVILDGRYVGLMQTDLRFISAYRAPANYGLANVTTGACTATLPGCTTATLQDGAVSSQYLWADGTRMASGGQGQLATLALERARRNPF